MNLHFRVRARQLLVMGLMAGGVVVGTFLWHPLILVVLLGVVAIEVALEGSQSP